MAVIKKFRIKNLSKMLRLGKIFLGKNRGHWKKIINENAKVPPLFRRDYIFYKGM